MTKNLLVCDGILSHLDASLHLGRYAEVSEEALMTGPELTPHGLCLGHLGQLESSLELLPCVDPLTGEKKIIDTK